MITPEFVPGLGPEWRSLFIMAVVAVAAVTIALITKGRLARQQAAPEFPPARGVLTPYSS